MTRWSIFLTVLTASVLAAGVIAEAAGPFHGRTSQGRSVSVRTDSDDRVQRVVIAWRASCDHASHLRSGTVFGTPFGRSKPGFFTTRGSYRDKGRDEGQRFKSVYRVRITGRKRSEARWAGSFRARVKFRYDDGLVVRCAAPSVSWAATA